MSAHPPFAVDVAGIVDDMHVLNDKIGLLLLTNLEADTIDCIIENLQSNRKSGHQSCEYVQDAH